MTKTVRGVLVTLLMAAMVVAFLAIADWIPSRAQGGFTKKFHSVEDAQRAMGMEHMMIPAYFSAGISWPPSPVVSQQKT